MNEDISAASGECLSKANKNYTLSIAIPTYNRATRLSRSLDELREAILREKLDCFSISVYVTDNGSTDDTKEILAEQSRKFNDVGVVFFHQSAEVNKGFDQNIKKCFTYGTADYCWFVSDDDNLEDGTLKRMQNDILKLEPNVIFYNFDQAPFGKESPLITERQFIIFSGTDFGFSQFIQFPKLTSLVIKRINDPLQKKVFDYDAVLSSGFSHIALAMHTAFRFGRVLLSIEFSARPDPDFRDHIDFPPYIGNRYNEMAISIFRQMGRPEWVDLHCAPHVDVGISALEWLTDHYMGRAVVPTELRAELHKGLKGYIAESELRTLLRPKFVRRCFYLMGAWATNFTLEKILHIKITKQRKKMSPKTLANEMKRSRKISTNIAD